MQHKCSIILNNLRHGHDGQYCADDILFSNAIFKENACIFYPNIPAVYPYGYNWPWVSFGSANGLVLNRRQTINRNNYDRPVHCRICTSRIRPYCVTQRVLRTLQLTKYTPNITQTHLLYAFDINIRLSTYKLDVIKGVRWNESWCKLSKYPLNVMCKNNYRKISNISRNKSQNFNDCCLVLQLSLPNPLKPDVKLRMKM